MRPKILLILACKRVKFMPKLDILTRESVSLRLTFRVSLKWSLEESRLALTAFFSSSVGALPNV